MEEPVGAQYAVCIALNTLKDRCRSLQQRIANLEEENVNLRVQLSPEARQSISITEMDKMKQQITELTEQKHQLTNKIKLVTAENQEVWSKLSTLARVNQNFGTEIKKINESIVQYKNKEAHSPLIRSKTFTQDEPHTKVLQKTVEENGKMCAELEEISLKIINSFAQGKHELDSFCAEIGIPSGDNLISESCGFYYDEFDNNILEDFHVALQELETTKELLNLQKIALRQALSKLRQLQELKNNYCDKNEPVKKEMSDKGTSTVTETIVSANVQTVTEPLLESSMQSLPTELDMICPICCKDFHTGSDFPKFQQHVESHFVEETYELL